MIPCRLCVGLCQQREAVLPATVPLVPAMGKGHKRFYWSSVSYTASILGRVSATLDQHFVFGCPVGAVYFREPFPGHKFSPGEVLSIDSRIYRDKYDPSVTVESGKGLTLAKTVAENALVKLP